MFLWSDNPDNVDLLDFDKTAASIADIIVEPNLSPITVGIEGDWGSGKSSMLGFIAGRFRETSEVVIVDTCPWEYDPHVDTQSLLITAILDAIRRHAESNKYTDKIKEKILSLLRKVSVAKVLRLTIKSLATWTIPDSDSLIDALSGADKKTSAITLEGFRKEFASLMTDLEDVSRVVVLVDDLDRCLPETVVAVMETIKLFLSVEKMAFVIAADRRAIGHAIATKYEPSRQARQLGFQYIEKIVQVAIPVPALLSPRDTEAYLTNLILRHYFIGSSLNDLIGRCLKNRSSTGAQLIPSSELELLAVPVQLAIVRDHLALVSRLAEHLYIPLNGNPRRLKRFLNALFLRQRALEDRISEDAATKISLDDLAFWMILEEGYPDAFEVLISWMQDDNFLDRTRECREGQIGGGASSSASATIQVWLNAVPEKMLERTYEVYLPVAASLRRIPTVNRRPQLRMRAAVRGDLRRGAELPTVPDRGDPESRPDRSSLPTVQGRGGPVSRPDRSSGVRQPGRVQRVAGQPVKRPDPADKRERRGRGGVPGR